MPRSVSEDSCKVLAKTQEAAGGFTYDVYQASWTPMTRKDAERTAPAAANCREDAGTVPACPTAPARRLADRGKGSSALNDRGCPCRMIPVRMRMPAPTTVKPRIPSILT